MMRPTIGVGGLMVLALPLAAPATEPTRHSGTVVAVDEARGTLLIEELGPWTGDLESTSVRREVRLAPDLEVTLVRRDPDGTGAKGWRGGFSETPIPRSQLRSGDYATVEARRRGADLVTNSIQVATPSGALAQ
jgi:hypothetical protein